MVDTLKNLTKLLDKQHVERVQPSTEYDGITGQTNAPSVMEQTPKPPIGHVTDKKMGWYQTLVDRGIPSEEFFKQSALLAQIVDLLQKQQQTDVPSDYVHRRIINVPAIAAGEVYLGTLQTINQCGFIYIPGNPDSSTTVNIFKDIGESDFISREFSNDSLSMVIPHIDHFTFRFDGPSDAFDYPVYMSTRPFRLTSYGSSDVLLNPPIVTGRYYDSSYFYGGATANSLPLVANTLYLSPFTTDKPFTISQIGINITVAGALNTDARLGIYKFKSGYSYDLATEAIAELVRDIGTVPTDAIAAVQTPISFTFLPGNIYGLAIVSDGAATINALTNMKSLFGGLPMTTSGLVTGLSYTFPYGALPAEYGPDAAYGGLTTIPRIKMLAS